MVSHSPALAPPAGPPPSRRGSVLILLGCLLIAVLAGIVTNWQMAVAVFLAAVGLFKATS
jgi:hypothetical protein